MHFLKLSGWQRISREERSKRSEGWTRPPWSGPAMSCGMSLPHSVTLHIWPAELPASSKTFWILVNFLFHSKHCVSLSPLSFLLNTVDSSWQSYDEGLSEKTEVSSSDSAALPPSGPEAPCPVVQYLSFLLTLFFDPLIILSNALTCFFCVFPLLNSYCA